MAALNGKTYEFGEFRLIPGEGLLLHNGEQVPLSLKAFSTLVILVERHGHLVERSELIETVWEDTFVEEANISKCVWAIRNALGEDPKSGRFIQTIPRRGYRFVAPVSTVADCSGAFRLPLRPEDVKIDQQHLGPLPTANGAAGANGSAVGFPKSATLTANGSIENTVVSSDVPAKILWTRLGFFLGPASVGRICRHRGGTPRRYSALPCLDRTRSSWLG